MPRPRLALTFAAAALVLSGCSQPTAATNPNSQQGDRTVTPPTVLRTPVQVDDAPAVVELPGRESDDEGDGEQAPEGG